MNSGVKKTVVVVAGLILVGAAVAIWQFAGAERGVTEEDLEREFASMPPHDSEFGEMKDMKLQFGKPSAKKAKKAKAAKAQEATSPALTGEEAAEAEEEKLVEAFDQLTDRWMEGQSKTPPTMKDIDAFAEQFRKLPDSRKDECIHRALNLIPDSNVMLLAGILMDKSQDKAIVKTVYNDVLNRDEDVKRPILEQIYKDKTHPCWEDTAWIFDVTGKKTEASATPAAAE